MKIGRNDLCPCGSGKKFKKCCLIKSKSIPKVTEIRLTPELEGLKNKIDQENEERRRKYLEPLGIYIDFVKPLIFQGRKFWALGNRLYYERPPEETFHEFIIFVLCQTLGEKWRLQQVSLPEEQQHFVYRCYTKYNEWRKKNHTSHNKKGEVWAALPDGWTRAFIALAFDICSLIHKNYLSDKLLNRLRNKDQYQGARYELAIMAMFARLGYKIISLDDIAIKTIHPEFIAEDLVNGEKIAVEVKSKQRKGVIHSPGKVNNSSQLLWGDIQRLYRHAMKQNPGNIPFLVFIDINSPQTPNIQWQDKPWVKDIKKMIDKAPLHNPQNPDPCSGLIFTNYSYHYQTENEAKRGEHLLTIPLYPIHKIQRSDFFARLEKALTGYGNIPNLDINVGK